MNNEVKTIKFVKGDNTAVVTSSKFNLEENFKDINGATYVLIKFLDLTINEMDDIIRILWLNHIPFFTVPIDGTWAVYIKEIEIDSFYVMNSKYEDLTKEQLIQILYSRDQCICEMNKILENLFKESKRLNEKLNF